MNLVCYGFTCQGLVIYEITFDFALPNFLYSTVAIHNNKTHNPLLRIPSLYVLYNS